MMRVNHTEEEILLDRSGVDHISKLIRRWLNECRVSKRDNLRVQFAMEDRLPNICEHFEGKAKCVFVAGKRFGVPYIFIQYEGERFDPSSDFELSEKLLANLGLTPQWSYQDGVNTLYLRAPRKPLKSEAFLLIAVVSAILIGLLTASSSTALSEMIDINEKKLGVSKRLNRFSLPLSNLLCGSTCGAAFVIILCYMAEYHSVSVNIGWFVNLWILCSVMSMATPPVSGGMLAVLGVLMSQLGIPVSGIAVAALLGIITDFIDTSSRIGIIHCEILLQANKLNMLDRNILMSKP